MSSLQEKTERLIEKIALDVICNGITTIYSNDKWTDIDPPKSFDEFKRNTATLFLTNLTTEVNSFIDRNSDVNFEQLRNYFKETDYYTEQDDYCIELHSNIVQVLNDLIPFLNHFGYFNESDTWKTIVLPFLNKNFDNFNFKLKRKISKQKSEKTHENEVLYDQDKDDFQDNTQYDGQDDEDDEEYEVNAEDGDVIEEVYKNYESDNDEIPSTI